MRFQVLVPSYNCAEWIERCLHSIAQQTYDDYRVLVIDDASSQNQNRQIIADFVNRQDPKKWTKRFNSMNLKCPANLVYGIHQMEPDPEDVIFIVDGDDFLPHSGVFQRVADAYKNPNVWLTYGNYAPYPENTGQVPAEAYSKQEIAMRNYRTRICFNHPLTFKYFLWENVPIGCMKYDDGSWFDVGYDRSIMFPMLEMADGRYEFLDEPLYYYNAVNPLSDVSVRLRAAQRVHRLLATRPKLDRLPDEARAK